MTLYQKLWVQEGTARRSESMQQSSATPKNQDIGIGLRKIVACSHSSSQCFLVPTVFGTVSSLHPTPFLMLFIVANNLGWLGRLMISYTCFTNFLSRLILDCSARRDDITSVYVVRVSVHVRTYVRTRELQK